MFRNFAYFGVKGVVWSDERCEGYRQEVKRIGGEFFSFESDKQEDEIRMEVSQWLQQLPKPVALFVVMMRTPYSFLKLANDEYSYSGRNCFIRRGQ